MRLSLLGLRGDKGRDPEVTGISVDSRQVRDGHLFAALPGSATHGADFIQYALRQGAQAILTDRQGAEIAADLLEGSDAALIVAEDPRAALSMAAALWFKAQPEIMVGVTGTSGKTSVATFTRQIWQALGHKAISLGTMGVQGDYEAKLAHTTPDPLTLHRVRPAAASAVMACTRRISSIDSEKNSPVLPAAIRLWIPAPASRWISGIRSAGAICPSGP